MADGEINEFEELKRQVDLAHVGRVLGIEFKQKRDGRWVAQCPWHDDDEPSLHVFTGDDGKQRWKCSPCGIHGDVYDLIQKRGEASSVTDAYDWLLDHKEDIPEPPEFTEPEPEDFTDEIEKFTGSVRLALEMFYHDRPERDEVDFDWIASEFDLRASESGEMLIIPQWSEEAELPAVRTRDEKRDWKPKGLPGSRHRNLYGIWRLDADKHSKVLLVEGESDTWAAAYWLRDHEDWCVLGLPSGATQAVRMEWVNLLQKFDVTIALDGDTTGREAAREWVERLAHPEAKSFPVRVATLPGGADICEVGRAWVEPLADHVGMRLVSEYHIKQFDIQTAVGRYQMKVSITTDDDGNTTVNRVPITDFTLEVVEVLRHTSVSGEARITLKVRSSLDGRVYRLDSDDLASTSSARRWTAKIGGVFMGNSATAAPTLWGYLMTCEAPFAPNYEAVSVLGWHGKSFVLPEDVLGEQTYRYLSPEKASVDNLVTITKAFRAPSTFDPNLPLRLYHLAVPEVSTVVIGWFAAAFARPLFLNEEDGAGPQSSYGFPILFIRGIHGSGKSEMTKAMARAFNFYFDQDIAGQTPYPIRVLAGASNAIPAVMDEFHPKDLRDDTRSMLATMWRAAWTGASTSRGGGEDPMSLDSMRATSPIVVIGEDDISGVGALEQRSVQLQLQHPTDDSPDVQSTRGSEIPQTISGRDVAGFGRWWISVILDELFMSSESHIFGPPPRVSSSRPEQAAAVVEWGYNAFREAVRVRLGVIMPPFNGEMAATEAESRSSTHPVVEALRYLLHAEPKRFEKESVFTDPWEPGTTRSTDVYVAIPLFIKQAKDASFELSTSNHRGLVADIRSLGFKVRESFHHKTAGIVTVLVGAADDPRLQGKEG